MHVVMLLIAILVVILLMPLFFIATGVSMGAVPAFNDGIQWYGTETLVFGSICSCLCFCSCLAAS